MRFLSVLQTKQMIIMFIVIWEKPLGDAVEHNQHEVIFFKQTLRQQVGTLHGFDELISDKVLCMFTTVLCSIFFIFDAPDKIDNKILPKINFYLQFYSWLFFLRFLLRSLISSSWIIKYVYTYMLRVF